MARRTGLRGPIAVKIPPARRLFALERTRTTSRHR